MEPWAEAHGWWSGLDEDPLDQTLCFSCISGLSGVGRELDVTE